MNRRFYLALIGLTLALVLLVLAPKVHLQGLWNIDLSADTASGQSTGDAVTAPLAFSCASVTEIPQSECEALMALYNSTSGAGWTNHTDWLVTNTPCSWFGVYCLNGHVYLVSLSNNLLNGTLPPQLGDLREVLGIYLDGNQLTGNIPPQVSNLTKLLDLSVSNNQLSGSIPLELANLGSLSHLNLNSNQFSGSIPAQLANNAGFVTLNLCCNQFSGSIPTQLGSLTSLTELNLSSNQLTGGVPTELGNLVHLTSLRLNSNSLAGALPANLTAIHPTSFYFDDTGLCESEDAAFQAWLGSISDLHRTGVICAAPATDTPTSTPLPPTATAIPPTPTNTLVAPATNTPTSIPVRTATPIAFTPTGTPGSTPMPTNTPVPPTSTATAISPNTPTSTPVPTIDGAWIFETIPDTPAGAVSLALDSAGNPHISYYGAHFLQDDLRYAWKDHGVWSLEVVDDGYEAGRSTSIALDSDGNPHIVYQTGGGDVRTLSLNYAHRTTAGWFRETIESGTFLGAYGESFALDTEGQPHVSYTGSGGPRYAYRTPNGWVIEPMAFAGSLALDANNTPHISYIAANSLKYAYRTATGWITEDVDSAYTTSSVLALDANGQPHISYLLGSASTHGKELRYASRTGSGWITERVDTADADSSSALVDVSMVAPTADNPHISYGKILWLLRHAYRTAGGWVTETVAGVGMAAIQSSIAVDRNGNPHIAYGADDLTYAYKRGQGTPTAPTNTPVPPTSTLVPPTGAPTNTPQPNTVPDIAVTRLTVRGAANTNPVVGQQTLMELVIANIGTAKYTPQDRNYSVVIVTKDTKTESRPYEYSSKDYSGMIKLPQAMDIGESLTIELPSVFFLEPITSGILKVSIELQDADLNLANNVRTKEPFTIDPNPDSARNCLTSVLNAIALLGLPEQEIPKMLIKFGKFFALDLPTCQNDTLCETGQLAKFLAELVPVVNIVSKLASLMSQPASTCLSISDYVYQLGIQFIERGANINTIFVESPAYVLVTNSLGQRVGFLDDGTIIQEIQGAQVVNNNGKKTVFYLGNNTQTVRIKATGSGEMRLRLVLPREVGTGVGLDFQGVMLVPETVGVIDVQDNSYLLNIDDNGDSVFDRSLLPTSVKVIDTKHIFLPLVENK